MTKILPAILLVLFSLIYTEAYSQLLLNEMMSYNFTVLEDQFGEYPDWIEIYNSGTEEVYLGDYWLSDDKAELSKWNLPTVNLPADAYIVIFASGRNIQAGLSYWHTLINIGDEWRYHIPKTSIDDSWKSSADATIDWLVGKSGIGYTDGDDSTIIDPTISLYMQRTFDISDLSAVSNAALYMDYDDGFIAYINGTEIARSSSMGNPGVAFNFDEPAISGHEANMYNGNPPESFFLSDYLNLLQPGENVLAVEAHNVGITSSDMSSIPFLLLGFNTVQDQYEFGNQYIVVKNEYPHANFKIASEGEAIYLTDGTSAITDSIPMISLPADGSYGRLPSNQTQFGYFGIPTPGTENNASFSSGYFTDSIELIISGEENDTSLLQMLAKNESDSVYYTTDGSEPDSSSILYETELEITATQVIRARILRSGNLPGPITTRTVFKGRVHDLPRVSVSTNPENLWDYNTGIYELGPNAQPDWPHWGANLWQDWEKPANIEIYDVNGEQWINQIAGIKIYGGASRLLPQKSFSFHARSEYGEGSFSYKLFREKDIDKFESFILRNDGGDWNQGMFRDAISGHIAGRLQVDRQGYQPMVLYLNGEYWGIINMREKLNEHFVASNHNVHTEDINIFQDNASLMSGSRTTYDALENYVRTHDLKNDGNYNTLKEMMDVDNYIRYWLLEVYLDNWDWPQHNIKFWNTQAPGSRYKWILYDTDFCYDLPGKSTHRYNTLKFSMGIPSEHPWINADWSNLLINALVKNDEFKNSFINQMADRMNYDFLAENIMPVVDSFKHEIFNEAPYHFAKWGGSVNNWYTNLDRIHNFVLNRANYMRLILIDQFNLTTTSDISVYVPDPYSGKVRVNTIVPDKYPFKGIYFDNVPIQLEAIPAPGYKFVEWQGSIASNSKIIDFDMNTEGTFTAIFEEVPDPKIDIVINEINYFSSPERNTDDWIELYNNSIVPVDISNWNFSDDPSGAKFSIPNGTIIPNMGYVVLSRSRPDFKRFYPELASVYGEFDFGLSSLGDAVALFNESGELHDLVIFESDAPWPTEPYGTGATLELTDPNLDNSMAQNWKASLLNGTPAKENSQFIRVDAKASEEIITSAAKLYPSVFHEYTTIEYNSQLSNHVQISVISVSGIVVDILTNQTLPAGINYINWTPAESGAEPGLYFIRIETSDNIQTLKAIYQ